MSDHTAPAAGSVGSPAPIAPRKVLLAAFASTFGWALDLFDLFLLLYVAPIVGKLFFPATTPTLSLAAVYASFAVALLVRPLGSAIFGAYADRKGRKLALMVAMVGVGLATAGFGLLPTIHQVGILAPILFLLLRVVQGLFVGGIVASTHTIGTESIPPQYRGLVSGLVGGAGAGIGALMASFAYFVLSGIFPDAEFDKWGWRFMFFTGLISTVFGLIMFKFLEESPVWKQLQAAKASGKVASAPRISPVRRLFGPEYRKVMFVNLLITFGGGATYYLTSGYLPTLLNLVAKVPHGESSRILMWGSVAVIVSSLLFGWLSDKLGRKPSFIAAGLAALIGLPLLFNAMTGAAGNVDAVLWYAIAISLIGGAAIAPIMIFLNERFATDIRASGTGLSWNIGFALGGTMPTFVSLAAATPEQIPMVLAIFGGTLGLVYLIGAVVIPETRGRTL
ncbi:MAG: MFS transporter [Pseudoxanthomonas sp.]